MRLHVTFMDTFTYKNTMNRGKTFLYNNPCLGHVLYPLCQPSRIRLSEQR